MNRGPTKWINIGTTEVIHDNLNPEFVKKIIVDYHFEETEWYKIEVYDEDDQEARKTNLRAGQHGVGHDFIGSIEFKLHEVVTARH